MRIILKSKIHRATVTDANINYEGSITIDSKLMKEANILPYEQVQVLNLNNGARFETYAIEGKYESGEICLNGAAARLAVIGDMVILLSYCHLSDEEALKPSAGQPPDPTRPRHGPRWLGPDPAPSSDRCQDRGRGGRSSELSVALRLCRPIVGDHGAGRRTAVGSTPEGAAPPAMPPRPVSHGC